MVAKPKRPIPSGPEHDKAMRMFQAIHDNRHLFTVERVLASLLKARERHLAPFKELVEEIPINPASFNILMDSGETPELNVKWDVCRNYSFLFIPKD